VERSWTIIASSQVQKCCSPHSGQRTADWIRGKRFNTSASVSIPVEISLQVTGQITTTVPKSPSQVLMPKFSGL
jgi:hypothetical protein